MNEWINAVLHLKIWRENREREWREPSKWIHRMNQSKQYFLSWRTRRTVMDAPRKRSDYIIMSENNYWILTSYLKKMIFRASILLSMHGRFDDHLIDSFILILILNPRPSKATKQYTLLVSSWVDKTKHNTRNR